MALTTVNSDGVKDDSIKNIDVKSDAAIAGSKIAPNFGSQNIVTTGTATVNQIIANSNLIHEIKRDAGSNTNGAYIAYVIDSHTTGTPGNGFGTGIQAKVDGVEKGRLQFFNNSDLKISTGSNSVAITIDANQKVGIGTESPSHLLHLEGASPVIQFEDTDNAANIYSLINAGGSAGRLLFQVDPADVGANSYVAFDIDGDETLRIDSSGRLLSNTTTEGHANADDLTIETTGHTGITLRSGTSKNGSLFFSDGTSGAAEYRGWVQYTHSDGTNDDYLTFGTNGGEKLRIDTSGNVGIGKDDPSTTLHVAGAVTLSHNAEEYALSVNASGQLQFFRNAFSNNTPILTLNDDTTRVKIGNTADATGFLDVQSTGAVGVPTIAVGGNNSSSTGTSRTDETAKAARIGCVHKTNAEEPFNLIYAVSGTENTINNGGGTAWMNAATEHKFYTAADTTTTTGTLRVLIDNDAVSIGTETPHCADHGVHIKTGDSGVTSAPVNRDDVFIEGSDHAGITISTANNKTGGIGFDDPDGSGRGRLQYSHSSEKMQIYTSGTNSFEFTDDLNILDGNLKVANGHGIDFSSQNNDGTGTSSHGELLDHYETGLFTPSLAFGSAKLEDNSGTYSVRYGSYTRIGRSIKLEFSMDLSDLGTPPNSSGIRIYLPFTSTSSNSGRNAGFINWFDGVTNIKSYPRIYQGSGTNYCTLYDFVTDADAPLVITHHNLEDATRLRGVIWMNRD